MGRGGKVRVFEDGTNRGTHGTYYSGDELGVERVGPVISDTLERGGDLHVLEC